MSLRPRRQRLLIFKGERGGGRKPKTKKKGVTKMNYPKIKAGPLIIEILNKYAPDSDELQNKFINTDSPELSLDETLLVIGAWKLNEDHIRENREKAWFDQHPWLK